MGALKSALQLCTVRLLLSLVPGILLSMPSPLIGKSYFHKPRKAIYVALLVCVWAINSQSAGSEARVVEVITSTGHEHHAAGNSTEALVGNLAIFQSQFLLQTS